MQTPHIDTKISRSPVSATKFVERSLHELDDLIQKRKLELSALRKSNRKRLLNGHLQTPAKLSGIKYSDSFSTPVLAFNLRDEDMLSYETPIMAEQFGKENMSFSNGDDQQILVDKMSYQQLLQCQQKLEQLQRDYDEFKANSQLLEADYQSLLQNCRNLSQENSKLTEDSLNKVSNRSAEEDAHSNGRHASDKNGVCESRREQEELLGEINELKSTCLEWEKSSKAAAESAFAWEDYSKTLNANFESAVIEWQTAIDTLTDENGMLKNKLADQSALIDTLNQQLAIPSDRNNNGARTDNHQLYEYQQQQQILDQQREQHRRNEENLLALMQIWNRQSLKKEQQYLIAKAFHAIKMNLFFKSTEDFYKEKYAEYLLQQKQELNAKYMQMNLLISSSSSNGSSHQNTTRISIDMAQAIRSKYKESYLLKKMNHPSNKRIPVLLLLACSQAALWIVILFVGHEIVSRIQP